MYLQEKDARLSAFFGFDWQFRHEDEKDYRTVQLPHDWSVEYPFDENAKTLGSGGYVKAGIGEYKKTFCVSKLSEGKRISIMFDGAYMNAKVTLNGKLLGEHVYGYTPFEFDITDALTYDGENEIIVRIDNSQQPNSRWYTGSGIIRDVWLKRTGNNHIPTYGTYITTEKVSEKEHKVTVQTKVEVASQAKLETVIYDSGGKKITSTSLNAEKSGEYKQEFTLTDANLWTAETPHLYRAVCTLRSDSDGAACDEYETAFGVRTVEFTPDKGCLINGKQVKLNGVCIHHDGGAVGAAVPKKLWRRRLIKLKEMGCNAIRCAHNPPDTALLDLCDELGFYVMDEAFDEWAELKWKTAGSNTHESRGYSEWFEDHHVADIEAMLYRDRNHPSIIMWSIGNEVPEQSMPNGHILAKKLQDICHTIDPSRLCTHANDQICSEPNPATQEFLDTLDIVGYNYTSRWRSRVETLYDDDKRANPNWLILGTENIPAAGRRGDYRLELPETYWKRPYFSAPVNAQKLLRFTMTHDYVIGDFMWTGIDYLGEAHWPDRSASWGVIDTCGFLKDHYYFYQSIWKRDVPMVYVFPHRNLSFPEGQIIPVLCYTNCDYAELFVAGKSYGKKSTSYPAYGMTETYGHWDKMPPAANTDDMFLSWDVPVSKDTIEVVGYMDEQEVCRHAVCAAGEPHKISASCDATELFADGRDIVHIEISIEDSEGRLNPVADNAVTVKVEGAAELIGVDNGKPDLHESFKGSTMSAFGGKLLAIIRAKREPGDVVVTLSSEGLEPAVVELCVCGA